MRRCPLASRSSPPSRSSPDATASPRSPRATRWQSFESRCEALPGGRIEVRRLPVAVTENYTVPVAQLARMSEPTSTHHRTVGLTRAKFGYRSTLELEGLEDAKGARACARPQVKIDIEVTGTTVYVAREFHGDACREPLILAHERLHVAVFDRYADEVVGVARARDSSAHWAGACATAPRWPASRRASSGSSPATSRGSWTSRATSSTGATRRSTRPTSTTG
jgi:hypothetical protein